MTECYYVYRKVGNPYDPRPYYLGGSWIHDDSSSLLHAIKFRAPSGKYYYIAHDAGKGNQNYVKFVREDGAAFYYNYESSMGPGNNYGFNEANIGVSYNQAPVGACSIQKNFDGYIPIALPEVEKNQKNDDEERRDRQRRLYSGNNLVASNVYYY